MAQPAEVCLAGVWIKTGRGRAGSAAKIESREKHTHKIRTAQPGKVDEGPGRVEARDSSAPLQLVGRGVLGGGGQHADLGNKTRRKKQEKEK